MIRCRFPYVDLAMKRIRETSRRKNLFSTTRQFDREVVDSFVTRGNCVNDYDIKSVEPSRYAIPANLANQIHGETLMSWTGWVFEMNDGRMFPFGTQFLFAFFELPDGFEFQDVRLVHNHSYLDQTGELASIHQNREIYSKQSRSGALGRVYRERPYFDCYINDD